MQQRIINSYLYKVLLKCITQFSNTRANRTARRPEWREPDPSSPSRSSPSLVQIAKPSKAHGMTQPITIIASRPETGCLSTEGRSLNTRPAITQFLVQQHNVCFVYLFGMFRLFRNIRSCFERVSFWLAMMASRGGDIINFNYKSMWPSQTSPHPHKQTSAHGAPDWCAKCFVAGGALWCWCSPFIGSNSCFLIPVPVYLKKEQHDDPNICLFFDLKMIWKEYLIRMTMEDRTRQMADERFVVFGQTKKNIILTIRRPIGFPLRNWPNNRTQMQTPHSTYKWILTSPRPFSKFTEFVLSRVNHTQNPGCPVDQISCDFLNLLYIHKTIIKILYISLLRDIERWLSVSPVPPRVCVCAAFARLAHHRFVCAISCREILIILIYIFNDNRTKHFGMSNQAIGVSLGLAILWSNPNSLADGCWRCFTREWSRICVLTAWKWSQDE